MNPGTILANCKVSDSRWLQIITSVSITAAGFLCYLIPGAGTIAGACLTSSGLSVLMKSINDPNLSWIDFSKECGVAAVVGLVTGGLSTSATSIKILGDSMFQAAVKGAIMGAATSATA